MMRIETRLFLHKLDAAARTGIFVRTSAACLRRTPFLDGRALFWDGPPVEAPLEAGIPAPGPDRMLFHVGFCGSTLLATLLDQPGRTLVLREPQALTDLASYRSALDRDGHSDPQFAPLLANIRAALRRPWSADERIVIKPSSWVNNLLPALAEDPGRIRPLFLTMGRRAFVRAVLRGGGARLAFAARACVHLANADARDARAVAHALTYPGDDEDRLLALAGLLHDIQLRLFHDAAAQGGWGDDHWLTLDALRADPPAALTRAARALAIDPPPGDRTLAHHAKQPDTAFSIGDEEAADVAIEAEHGRRIDRILGWRDEYAARQA